MRPGLIFHVPHFAAWSKLPDFQLRRLIPRPLELAEPVVNYEFISMPDSTGFGSYCESGQVIPVKLGNMRGNFGE